MYSVYTHKHKWHRCIYTCTIFHSHLGDGEAEGDGRSHQMCHQLGQMCFRAHPGEEELEGIGGQSHQSGQMCWQKTPVAFTNKNT